MDKREAHDLTDIPLLNRVSVSRGFPMTCCAVRPLLPIIPCGLLLEDG
jgi:hypothetical protein